MLYKKAFFFIYILSVLTFGQKLYSQKSDYLEFSVSADREFFSDKDTIRLALNIKIINPYHINSYKVEDPSLINTTVSVNDDNFKMPGTL